MTSIMHIVPNKALSLSLSLSLCLSLSLSLSHSLSLSLAHARIPSSCGELISRPSALSADSFSFFPEDHPPTFPSSSPRTRWPPFSPTPPRSNTLPSLLRPDAPRPSYRPPPPPPLPSSRTGAWACAAEGSWVALTKGGVDDGLEFVRLLASSDMSHDTPLRGGGKLPLQQAAHPQPRVSATQATLGPTGPLARDAHREAIRTLLVLPTVTYVPRD